MVGDLPPGDVTSLSELVAAAPHGTLQELGLTALPAILAGAAPVQRAELQRIADVEPVPLVSSDIVDSMRVVPAWPFKPQT